MRLVTRADLDGLACALVMAENDSIDDIVLVHPQEITDKKADIREGDVVANRTTADVADREKLV